MVALKAAQIDSFVARADPKRQLVLVYGPDAGLVRERVDAIIRASVDDPHDPFALARLDGDALAGEPMRLIEEASTVPLFGGRRAIWVKASTRTNMAPAVEALLAAPSFDGRVVIEAGDLKPSSPLRRLCEQAAKATALPCYVDSEESLGRLVDDEMREAGLGITKEARAALVALIGGDRQASRSEIRKLALYARGKDSVELDDVEAAVADASALAVDNVVDAAFAGRPADLEMQFAKAQMAGTSVGSIMFVAQRQVAQLHKARLAMEAGQPIAAAVEAVAGRQFRRQPAVEAALKAWTAARLVRVMAQLAEAAFEARREASLAESVAHRVLLSLAVNARRKG